MTNPTPQAPELAVDTSVWTADGQQFGYVKEVRTGYFKVDVPMAPDYWLSTSHIDTSNTERVTLVLAKDELDDHKLAAPGIEPEANGDQVLPASEQLAQRERMERELEAQRNRMQSGL